ncbi:hypothetical protein HMI54_001321 [Coelomomyces lativittatus]|nr:hypothetical protein HMI56_003532 [Coelomomyces lativittatus]KAJ1510802.1 hypothetical protein HMI54_001321 [Coelomomyces lativittatus]
MEHLSNQTLLGDADRGRVNFKEDADVLPIFRAKQKDYMKSGYSRGHMSAASNNKICPEAMAESFLLNTNIVPQDLDNNMFYWGRMENWIRKLVLDRGFEDVHVISGPLFLPSSSPPKEIPSITPLNQAKETTHPSSSSSSSSSSFHVLPSNSYEPLLSSILLPPPSDVYTPPTSVPSNTTTTTTSLIPGKPFHYMLYKLIGDTQVAVPTHLFKAVLASVGDQRYLACFIVPNTPIADHVPLKLFQVPQSVLEKYTGFVVFDRLMKKGNGVKVLDLCETKDRKGNLCDMGTPEEFQFMVFGKKLKKASSPSHLDTLHQEIQEYAQLRAVNVPKELLRLYHHKKSEFQNHTVKQASPHSVASKKEETSRS